MRNPFYKLESYLQDIALENKIKNHINRYHYSYRITRYIIVLTIIIYYACILIPDISHWVLKTKRCWCRRNCNYWFNFVFYTSNKTTKTN